MYRCSLVPILFGTSILTSYSFTAFFNCTDCYYYTNMSPSFHYRVLELHPLYAYVKVFAMKIETNRFLIVTCEDTNILLVKNHTHIKERVILCEEQGEYLCKLCGRLFELNTHEASTPLLPTCYTVSATLCCTHVYTCTSIVILVRKHTNIWFKQSPP